MDGSDAGIVLILVRAAPGSLEAERARRTVREIVAAARHDIIVFFHGEAVAAAGDGQAADWGGGDTPRPVKLLVCQSAWKRRFDQAVAAGFEVSSLVQFWQLAIDAEEIYSFGARHGN